MSSVQNPYGFKFFDRPTDYSNDDEDNDDDSCPAGCCDRDCECDDCLRCSNNGLLEPDSYSDEPAAAA